MKLTEVTALGIRVFAILLFLKMASSFTSWFIAIETSIEPPFSKTKIFLTYVLPTLLSLVAIKFPVTIAKFLVPSSSQTYQELESDGRSIQLAAFVILGVFIFTNAIPGFIYNALMIFFYVNTDAELDKTPYYINELTKAIEIIIGLYLALGANGIFKLIERLRYTGAK
jgi:hypothetical protein